EWRLIVEEVIDAKRNRGVVQPRSPSARIVFRGGDRRHILVLAAHLHVLAAILRVTGDFGLSRWRWQVERVVQDPVHRNPLTNFARGRPVVARTFVSNRCESIVIPVLADVVDDKTRVDTLQPGTGRTIIKQAGVPTVGRKRTATIYTLEAAAEFTDNGLEFAARHELEVNVRHVGLIPCGGKCSPITVTEARGIEDFNHFEVPGR